jgi:hypothetical protein
VPDQNFRDFALFNVDFKCWNWPSAQCITKANAINSDANIFNACLVLVSMIN